MEFRSQWAASILGGNGKRLCNEFARRQKVVSCLRQPVFENDALAQIHSEPHLGAPAQPPQKGLAVQKVPLSAVAQPGVRGGRGSARPLRSLKVAYPGQCLCAGAVSPNKNEDDVLSRSTRGLCLPRPPMQATAVPSPPRVVLRIERHDGTWGSGVLSERPPPSAVTCRAPTLLFPGVRVALGLRSWRPCPPFCPESLAARGLPAPGRLSRRLAMCSPTCGLSLPTGPRGPASWLGSAFLDIAPEVTTATQTGPAG